MILMLLVILFIVYSTTDVFKNEKASGSKNGAQQSSKNSRENAAKSMYPFSAMDKAKNCIQLSAKIADAKNRGVEHSKLSKQHAKECG